MLLTGKEKLLPRSRQRNANLCDGCKKQFLRLSTHLSHYPVCVSHYIRREMGNVHRNMTSLTTVHRTRRSQIPLTRENESTNSGNKDGGVVDAIKCMMVVNDTEWLVAVRISS